MGQRLAEEIRLPRLKPEQTATMTRATLGRPVPAQVLAAIHARSDGIPLHVEEFLAAIDDNALTAQSGAAVQAAAVPDTLADAVLTRARRLASRSRQVAAAAAVIGRSFDFDLLTAVTEGDPDEVAGALRELQDAYFVLPGADAVTYDFRHALIRDALYTDTGLPLRRRLHERVARTAVERGYRDAFISAHFEQAGNPGLAYEYAVAAAREAALLSAHGEALELYRRALRNLPAQLGHWTRPGCWLQPPAKPPPPTTTRPRRRRTRPPTSWSPALVTCVRRPRWRRAWPRSRTCSARASMPASARCKRR